MIRTVSKARFSYFMLILTFFVVLPLINFIGKNAELRPSLHFSIILEPRNVTTSLANDQSCTEPSEEFRSWENGLVTTLHPEINKDCKKLFAGDKEEIERLQPINSKWKNNFTDEELLNTTRNCSFVKEYFNNNFYTTKLESSFPIAFVFVIHNSPQQIIRLLRVLYRPHNQYCIHPDRKSSTDFLSTFRNIAGCLDNIHIPSELIDVRWGHRSLMISIMNCYKTLIKVRETQQNEQKWKYVINLCGKEVPLKTNHQIVTYLSRLNGTSMVDAEMKSKNNEAFLRLKMPIPHDIPFAKASLFMALSPTFTNFLFTNSTAITLYEFFQYNCTIPEEHYFATVYMLPNVPGGFNPDLPKNYSFAIEHCLWVYHDWEKEKKKCHGKLVHNICLANIGDLSWILNASKFGSDALFHNKLDMESDHLVMDCMEEALTSQNKLEYQEDCGSFIE